MLHYIFFVKCIEPSQGTVKVFLNEWVSEPGDEWHAMPSPSLRNSLHVNASVELWSQKNHQKNTQFDT